MAQEKCANAFKRSKGFNAPHMYVEIAFVPALHDPSIIGIKSRGKIDTSGTYQSVPDTILYRPGLYVGVGKTFNRGWELGVGVNYYSNDIGWNSENLGPDVIDEIFHHYEVSVFVRKNIRAKSPYSAILGLARQMVYSEFDGWFYHKTPIYLGLRYKYDISHNFNAFIEPQFRSSIGAISQSAFSTITYNYSYNIHAGFRLNL